MKRPGRLVKWVGAAVAAAVVVVLAVRAWVVPAVIASQVQAVVGGRVTIDDWWLNGRSAGVKGLKVYEGPAADAPVWATARRVSTDLSIGGLLRGRFAPGRVRLEGPEVTVRFDRKGTPVTKFGGAAPGGQKSGGTLPVVIADGAKLTMQQEGRPALVVTGVTARLGPSPDGGGVVLSARSNDPDWGPFEAHGNLDRAFKTGRVVLKTMRGVAATAEKTRAIPFVPPEVWQNVAPTGEVDVTLGLTLDRGAAHVRTEITLRGTTARSDTLDLTAAGTTGRVIVDDALVTFENVSGRAIDGRVTGNGTADFGKSPAAFDLNLALDSINVADTPKAWQLREEGITGQLSGLVRLRARLLPDGVDLTGTSGDVVVDKATYGGIAVKSLKLVVSADGNDLKYDAPEASTGPGRSALPRPSGPATALARATVAAPRVGLYGVWAGLATVALQPPEAPAKAKPAKPATRPTIHLPKSIRTHLELEDVEVAELIARAQFLLGYPFPVPVTGRLSIKADATLPLGRLKSVRDYAFHGDVTLTRASAFKVDLGRLTARLDLADGVLHLRDLRGHLVDRPDGGPDNPPVTDNVDVPATGPLPPGGFRGSLSASISPPGKLSARFEGNQLPLGELSAPVLPRPTPLSGLATLNVEAESDLSAASDPAAWTVRGTAGSRQIHYHDATLDGVAVAFDLSHGHLDVSELTALLRDRPLRARLGLDLKPPRAFRGVVDVAGWDLAEVLAWVPQAPKSAPVAGTLSARAEASGTLTPLAVKTEGRGSFERLQAGPVALGAVPFQWTTRGDSVALSVTDARPFGGRLTAEANVPLVAGKPIDGSATVTAVDTAAMSAAVPGGGLKLSGRASGKVTFSVPSDVSSLEARARLAAPDLTVQGVPVEQVKATVKAHRGLLGYEVSAESLGGEVRFTGDFPLAAAPARRAADGELRAADFALQQVWKALGVSGVAARLAGRGAVDANLRAVLDDRGHGLYVHGLGELRDLKWGDSPSLGGLRGVLVVTPDAWRVAPIGGSLLGGLASGSLWGSGLEPTAGRAAATPRQVGFDVRVDRAPLREAAALLPVRGLDVQGYASLRAAGSLGEVFRASGELYVPHAKVGGLPVGELKIPAEVSTSGGFGAGVVHLRRYSARLAGGSAHGNAWFHLGADHAFQGDLTLTDVDLESIARIKSEAKRPASGKVSGRVTLYGPDPLAPRHYRGRVALELSDASLVAVPVFRELDKFLGSARGGLFESGDLNGTIANRLLVIDSATLSGRLAQLHVTGTVGMDSQLNLEVLVNTNPILSEAGASLASSLPGLRGAVGRNHEASAQVTSALSNKLMKLRVTGTLGNPSVGLDPSIGVGRSAVSFFTGMIGMVR